ncbi:hypothetical protein Calab_1340 [Caldithrix abyssi DSM 13497]|uniref:Uncharacterized protein n=1 Tax=Caldithrix abyssi DSM 13497 TaxID=880073 RepID=H1XYU4_CALAY|nr:hypothetical protein [Caldithrix abyssi]EHO40963.1 hypothetical protein Calab_1340 [Caldithrix abyssi DSM 13497]
MNVKIWLILFFCLTGVRAQKNSFLIVEKPESLKLLNVYRQEMDESEKRQLGRFVPMRLGQVTTFADGVTQAYRVNILNRLLYLLIDSEGQPVNLANAGFSRWEYGVRVLQDTVEIQPGYDLQLLNPKTHKPMASLQAGQLLVRIFSKRNVYYVALLSDPPRYGQLKRPPAGAWKKIRPEVVQKNRTFSKMLQEVRFVMQAKNEVYKKLYLFFRPEKSSEILPQWKVTAEGEVIKLTFNRPELLEKWPKSAHLLFREIKAMAERNGFKVQKKNAFNWHIGKWSQP